MRARAAARWALGVALLALSGGCKGDPSPTEAVWAALDEAGLATGERTATSPEPFRAEACERGTVEGLELLVCSYGSEEAAQLGQRAVREALAASALTAVARRHGARVVGLADRDKVDPRGRKVMAVLHALEPPEPAPAGPTGEAAEQAP